MHNSSEMQYLWTSRLESSKPLSQCHLFNSCHQERSGGYLQDVMKTSQPQLGQSEHARPQRRCCFGCFFLYVWFPLSLNSKLNNTCKQYQLMHPLNTFIRFTSNYLGPQRCWTLKLSHFNSGDCWKYTYFIGISIFYWSAHYVEWWLGWRFNQGLFNLSS